MAKRGRKSMPPAGVAGVWGDPSSPVARRHAELILTGMRAFDAGDIETAKRGFRAVLDENIEHPDGLLGMGLVARKLGQLDTAAELIRRAIAINPRAAAYWSNLGNIYQDQERWDDAVEAQRQAVRLNPRHDAIRQNLGSLLNLVDRPYEALPHFREAMKQNPASADVVTNFATVLNRVGEYGTSNRYFRRALELDRANPIANFNFGASLNWQGSWEEGWPLYDWRFLAPSMARQMPRMQVSPDLPMPIAGKRVFLAGEQGIGDEIRFATMVPDLLQAGARVVLSCKPKLLPLFARSFPAAEVVTGTEAVGGDGAKSFDAVLPTGSLGRHLRSGRERFPRDRKTLVPDADRVAALRARVERLGPGLKVGLCWRSSLRGQLRNEFYARIDDLAPVLAARGVVFVNLQYDECAEELARARASSGVTVHAFDDLDLFDDLDGSAALTAALDMVVSANTAVAAIAGGVGVPTVEFHGRPIPPGMPIDGRDPWFPSVTPLGKRIAASWDRVMRQIRDILEAEASDRKG